MTRMLIATSHFFAKWWLLMLAVLVFLKIGSQESMAIRRRGGFRKQRSRYPFHWWA